MLDLFHVLFASLPTDALIMCLYCTSSPPPGNPSGKITIQVEEVQESKFVVDIELSAAKLEKKDLFGKV